MLTRKLATLTIRTSEVVLNLLMRGSYSGLEALSKLRVQLDIPDFYVSVRNRDHRAIVLMINRLARAGHSPLQVYSIAARGVEGLDSGKWAELVEEAYKVLSATRK